VVSGNTALTYRRLDAAANQWANRLVERGVRPGERVGLLLGRSPEFVVAMLAVLKAGATYVPVDPTDPRDRQDRLVRTGRLRYLLSAHELPHPFVGIDTDVVIIVPGADAPPSGVSSDPSTPAYILFTSGSTGEPKGVMVTHRNVVRLFAATRDHFGFGLEDRWLNAHNVTFDASVWEIYGAILHGACVVIAPPRSTASATSRWSATFVSRR
jgi:non-ribosomal peptide synthetase component F